LDYEILYFIIDCVGRIAGFYIYHLICVSSFFKESLKFEPFHTQFFILELYGFSN